MADRLDDHERRLQLIEQQIFNMNWIRAEIDQLKAGISELKTGQSEIKLGVASIKVQKGTHETRFGMIDESLATFASRKRKSAFSHFSKKDCHLQAKSACSAISQELVKRGYIMTNFYQTPSSRSRRATSIKRDQPNGWSSSSALILTTFASLPDTTP